jgi:hypothetical protein
MRRQKFKTTNTTPAGTADETGQTEAELTEVWAQCEKLWPTEKAAVQAVFKVLEPVTRCSECNSTDFSHEYGERQVKCNGCGRRFSFTANTFFHGAHLIRPLLVAMRFKEEGIKISHMRFQKLVNVWYDTAWRVAHKVMHVVLSLVPDSGLEVNQRLLEALVSKRSRETPARCHPRQERSHEAAGAEPQAVAEAPDEFSAEELGHLTADDKKVWDLLGEQYVHFD